MKIEFPKHACQHCWCERKRVETLIDDEFIWDEWANEFTANGFGDNFSHTWKETCCECGKKWTGF